VRTALLLVLSIAVASAQAAQKKVDPLQPFGFLLGKWNGQGGGQQGAGTGAFSFDVELDGHILVRHNYAEYGKDASAISRHDDLLIVYLEDGPRAIYFDSEGHVIRYRVTIPQAGSVVFESDGSPRYRLSYVLQGAVLEGTFEIAESARAPYKTYLSWTAKK
jgi:hypothetical protein